MIGIVDLSVVIVNWNCGTYTRACADSVAATTHGLAYEIVVVDNASTDGSLDLLEGLDRHVRLLTSPENVGFGRANNAGVRIATGRHLLFLNPDTLVVGDALARMVSVLDAWPEVGAVGCRLLNSDGTLQTTCVQRFPTIVNQVLDTDWLKRRCPTLRLWGMAPLLGPERADLADVEVISGACLMVPRAVFAEVGGFSPEYFLYAEDVDLCWKIRRTGRRVCHVPDAEVMHYGGGSSTKESDGFSDVVMRESIQRFLHKTRGPRYAATYRSAMRATATLRLLLLHAARLLLSDRASVARSLRKWRRIGRWSRGQEAWAAALGTPPPGRARG